MNYTHLFSLCMTLNVKNETATRIPIRANVDMVTYIRNGTATTLCITYVESRGIWPSICDKKTKTTPLDVQCFLVHNKTKRELGSEIKLTNAMYPMHKSREVCCMTVIM